MRTLAALYLLILMGVGLLSFLFPLETSVIESLQAPSFHHWWGTDELGRDLLLRCLRAGLTSLTVGAIASLVSFVIGTAVGLVSGWRGGLIDTICMRTSDILDSLPDLLFVAVVVFLFRELLMPSHPLANLSVVGIGMGLCAWMSISRQTRALALRESQRDYVTAAQTIGAKSSHILVRHVFPNIRRPILLIAFFQIPNFIIFEGSLSFFGLGIQPPQPSWGLILNEGWRVMSIAPWVAIAPGALMMTTLVAFSYCWPRS